MHFKKLFLLATPATLHALPRNSACLMSLVRGGKVEEMPDASRTKKSIPFVVGKDIYNPAAIYRHYHNEYGMRLMEAVRSYYARKQTVHEIMVMGSGSGVDTAVAARIFPQANLTAADYSTQAVMATKATAELNEIADRVTVLRSNVFQDVPPQEFDLILFNAPRDISREKRDSRFSNPTTFDTSGNVTQDFLAALPERLSDGGSAFVMTESVLRYPLDKSLTAEIVSGPYSWANPWLSRAYAYEESSFAIWRIFRK